MTIEIKDRWIGSTGPTPVYEAVLAAIFKATTPNAGERG